ncbi:head-tail connector protein [Fusobacterium sp.]|uniref:head-tail connector protein n=1 Tax=Fusobacterium sp. TaxID=68766 RepID=UPI0026313ABF|nr:head-tail connector protein [Fusobacterium sp.]
MRVLTLENIKEYLRVDSDEDDTLIRMLEDYAKEEIEDSTGVPFNIEGNSETYNMAVLIIIADRYENRSSTDTEFKVNNILSSIYTRLKAGVTNV